MANALLTIDMITREAVRLWKNSNEFIQNIDTQYDDSYAKTGAKIGSTLRIRLPNDFTVRTGQAASVQDTSEQQTTLTLATQQGVDVSFSSADRTLSLDDFSRRVLAPVINNLAGAVAINVMSGIDTGGCANFVAQQDASGNITHPIAATWLQAGAILDINSAPRGNRKLMLDPLTMANTVASLAGLLNPQGKIGTQYDRGQMQQALGWDWNQDQTVLKHLTASYTGTGSPPFVATTISGANQTGLTITTAAITGGLNAGDIITIEGVNAVNRITKQSTGQLRQFVVTADVATGGTSVSIYPAIVPGVGGDQVQYQTVDVSPDSGADVSVVTLSGTTYRKNFGYVPEAIAMVTADLELPRGVHEAARDEFDGIAMRIVSDYNVQSDQFITRLDVLYGFLYIRPEWVVAVGDSIN